MPLIELGFSLGPVADFSKLSKKSSPENLIKFLENRQWKSLILKGATLSKNSPQTFPILESPEYFRGMFFKQFNYLLSCTNMNSTKILIRKN